MSIPIVKTNLHQHHIPAIVSSMGIRIRMSVRLKPSPVVIAPHQQLHTIVATHLLHQRVRSIIVLSLEIYMRVGVVMQRGTDIAPQPQLHTIVATHVLHQQVRSIIVLSLEIYMLEIVKHRVL